MPSSSEGLALFTPAVMGGAFFQAVPGHGRSEDGQVSTSKGFTFMGSQRGNLQ